MPAAAVQREHERLPQRLPQRVFPGQHGELGGEVEVPAERENGFGAPLQGVQSQLGEVFAVPLGEPARHPGQRFSLPERERGLQLGALDFLTKPVTAASLRTALGGVKTRRTTKRVLLVEDN